MTIAERIRLAGQNKVILNYIAPDSPDVIYKTGQLIYWGTIAYVALYTAQLI